MACSADSSDSDSKVFMAELRRLYISDIMHFLRQRKSNLDKGTVGRQDTAIAKFEHLHEVSNAAQNLNINDSKKTESVTKDKSIEEKMKTENSMIVKALIEPLKPIIAVATFIAGTFLVMAGAIGILFTNQEKLKQH